MKTGKHFNMLEIMYQTVINKIEPFNNDSHGEF